MCRFLRCNNEHRFEDEHVQDFTDLYSTGGIHRVRVVFEACLQKEGKTSSCRIQEAQPEPPLADSMQLKSLLWLLTKRACTDISDQCNQV